MEFTATTTSTASKAACWAVLTDIADWPNWTASITAIAPVDAPELAVGRRYRLTQPGMPVLTWTVTKLDEGESFDWEARSPGVRTLGWHRISPDGEGTRIDIGVRQTGPLAWLFGLLGGAKTRRFMTMEAAGLKAAGESR
ncbi:SRPBCC family protein [Phytomonospora endophytica]|uniref:Polyketide cyclase n=1 Tax=Phytomonospora endophytica TaxID=714109 RepID=A0A841FD33_9ACTN|nr:SRPBCC family protein [Phytomonospora endophytica]MBB6034186.1 hypothetical protein [Phytomonospora endophytica]GIG66578.1 hypothetical protein Pen01_28730 [Phytomonospora endophytica]